MKLCVTMKVVEGLPCILLCLLVGLMTRSVVSLHAPAPPSNILQPATEAEAQTSVPGSISPSVGASDFGSLVVPSPEMVTSDVEESCISMMAKADKDGVPVNERMHAVFAMCSNTHPLEHGYCSSIARMMEIAVAFSIDSKEFCKKLKEVVSSNPSVNATDVSKDVCKAVVEIESTTIQSAIESACTRLPSSNPHLRGTPADQLTHICQSVTPHLVQQIQQRLDEQVLCEEVARAAEQEGDAAIVNCPADRTEQMAAEVTAGMTVMARFEVAKKAEEACKEFVGQRKDTSSGAASDAGEGRCPAYAAAVSHGDKSACGVFGNQMGSFMSACAPMVKSVISTVKTVNGTLVTGQELVDKMYTACKQSTKNETDTFASLDPHAEDAEPSPICRRMAVDFNATWPTAAVKENEHDLFAHVFCSIHSEIVQTTPTPTTTTAAPAVAPTPVGEVVNGTNPVVSWGEGVASMLHSSSSHHEALLRAETALPKTITKRGGGDTLSALIDARIPV